jgi:hypothetical protein
MARQFLQSTRPLVRVARNNIEIVATLAAIAAGAIVPLPTSRGGDRGGPTVAVRTADSEPRVGAASPRPVRLLER